MGLVDGQQISIAGNTSTNVFLGRPVEFIGAASVMRLLFTADGPGLTGSMLVNVGGQQSAPLSAGTPLPTAGIPGAGPKDDEDTVIAAVPISPGSRLQLNISNTTAGALVMRYRAILAP